MSSKTRKSCKKSIRKIVITLIVFMLCLQNVTQVSAYYNTNDATVYARKWAQSRNPNFPDFKRDCTNFVSQCAYAGGISVNHVPDSNVSYSDLDDTYKTKTYWGCKKYTKTRLFSTTTDFVYTSTWTVVAKNTGDSWWGFYNYMKDKGASCIEYQVNTVTKLNTFLSKCQIGDILQVRESTADLKSHSVIVTDKSYDSTNKRWDIKIAYHTNDTPPTDFRSVSWRKFGTSKLWTIIKF